MSHRSGHAFGLIFALVVACSGGGEHGKAPSSRGRSSSDPAAGHARMIALLDRVADEARRDNPFVGREQPESLRRELAALPEGLPDLRRWLFHGLLARHAMRLGHDEEAVDHALEAYAQLGPFASEIPEEKAIETVFLVGVAWMRRGESLNCAQRHTAESCLLPISGGGVHVDPQGSEEASRYFTEVLLRTPPDSWWHVKARWLLNIAAMTLGRWPEGLRADWRIGPEYFESDEPFPRFAEIAPALGLAVFDMSGGVVTDDFDGDGRIDVLVSTADPDGPMRLFVNGGDGSFTERTAAAGLTGLRGGLNMVQADFDNDGDVDVLVLRGAWWGEGGRHPNSLLRNDGGVFTDVTFDAGLGDVHWPTQAAAWADFDLDGHLDLYVGNEWTPELPARGQLFRNRGDGTFEEIAEVAGVANEGFAKSVAWGDYDDDGDPDLFVANMGQPNRLYRNDGNGKFTDVAAAAGVERPLSAFPSWFWDFDNDGKLDLYVGGYGGPGIPPDVGYVAAALLGLPTRAERDRLYRGDGQGRFTDVAEQVGLTAVTLPMGANYGDLDSDGWLDFYLGTGYPYFEGLMPNLMFRNREGRGFADVTTAGGFGHLQKGHGIAFADFDDDGDEDVYAQMGGMYPGDAFGNALFENPGGGGRSVRIELSGTRANRMALGARLRLTIREPGGTREIYRLVGSGASFGSSPLRPTIGVGRAERIERLEIRWPSSSPPQVLVDLPVGGRLQIVEGEPGFRHVELAPLQLRR